MLWLAVTPEIPRSLPYFFCDPCLRLSHHLPMAFVCPEGKGHGKSSVAFEIHLHSVCRTIFHSRKLSSPSCSGHSATPWLNEICKQQCGNFDMYNEYDYSLSCIFITHAPPCEAIFLIGSKAISTKALKNYPFPVFISWYQRNDYLKHNQQEGIGFLLLSSHCYSFRRGEKTPQGNTISQNTLSG